MINPFKEINWNPDRKALRSFGRTLVIGGVIGDVLFGLLSAMNGNDKLAIIQNVFTTIAIIGVPIWILPGKWAIPVYRLWFVLGASIGIVLSNLTLILFYYLFFTPIALTLKLTGRDPLQLRAPTADTSYAEVTNSLEEAEVIDVWTDGNNALVLAFVMGVGSELRLYGTQL